jgi:predicted transcriptional regulator
MSANITLSLPDVVYRRVQRLAEQSGRDMADILETVVSAAVPGEDIAPATAVERLNDADLLRMAESEMDAAQSARMSELLERQQAGTLSDIEQFELSLLLHRYQEGSLRKAEALAEAVRRGLRSPIRA